MIVGSTIGIGNLLVGLKESTYPLTRNFIDKKFSNEKFVEDGHYERLFNASMSLLLIPIFSGIKGTLYGTCFPFLALDGVLYPRQFGRHFVPMSSHTFYDVLYETNNPHHEILDRYSINANNMTNVIIGCCFTIPSLAYLVSYSG